LDMRSSESFDTVRFRTKLSDYLLDQWVWFDTILIQRQNSPTPVTNLDQRTRTIQWVFKESLEDSTLQSLQVFEDEKSTQLEITLWISTSLTSQQLSLQLIEYQKRLEELFETWVEIIPKIQFFELVDITVQ
jgi:hypothetical protein